MEAAGLGASSPDSADAGVTSSLQPLCDGGFIADFFTSRANLRRAWANR